MFGMNKGKTIKSMFNTYREGENKISINAGKEELTGDRKYGRRRKFFFFNMVPEQKDTYKF